MSNYLYGIACKLAGPYCPDIRIYVERTPFFNATMAPNGSMTIWTGFLLRTQNEAQIAAVIGHEIGHYIRRHGIQRLADARAKADFTMAFSMVAFAFGVPAAGDVAQLMTLSSILSYSRDNEREADLIGINLMARYGYDTREASKIWQQLVRETDPDGEKGMLSTSTPFASSHPPEAERMTTLANIAEKIQGPGKWGSKGQETFDAIIAPRKFDFLRDEVRLRNWESSLELLTILAENGHPKNEIAYFKGEIYRQRNREADTDAKEEDKHVADIERAINAYEECIAAGSPPPQAYRALGQIYQRQGKTDHARANLGKYLDAAPDASDASMIRYVIRTMTGPSL